MRFLRIFSPGSWPSWALFGWAMLGELHEAHFAMGLWQSTYAWMEHHVIATIAAGFAWLILVIFWPDLKKRLPDGMRLPKTTHEHVHDINKQLIAQQDHNAKASKNNSEFGNRMQALGGCRR
jgi:hypothetical protein